jgi:hypothetical protein
VLLVSWPLLVSGSSGWAISLRFSMKKVASRKLQTIYHSKLFPILFKMMCKRI